MDDYSDEYRGAAALLAAEILHREELTPEQRSRALGRVLKVNEDLLARRWHYVNERDSHEPQELFFSFDVDSTDDGYHSIWLHCYPAEGTISVCRSIDEPGYVDLDPKAWFTVDDAEGVAAVLDAIPQLTYKDDLPEACYRHGAIVEWGDALYGTTLSAEQVRARRRGPAPMPADQVLDALRDVYDTCPRCGTYTGGQSHDCP